MSHIVVKHNSPPKLTLPKFSVDNEIDEKLNSYDITMIELYSVFRKSWLGQKFVVDFIFKIKIAILSHVSYHYPFYASQFSPIDSWWIF